MSTDTYHAHIAQLNAQIREQSARITQLETDAAWRIKEHDAAIADYQHTVEKLERQIARLNGDIDALETECAQLEEDARIVAGRLYASTVIVSTFPDAYLMDLRSEE